MAEENEDFIYIKALERGYTEQEFIGLNDKEIKEFAEALSPNELAKLHNKIKYLYSDDANAQLEAIVSFLALK